MAEASAPPPIVAPGLTLDPFSFMPNLASRIAGLGGPDATSDLSYAFHTSYTGCAPGPVTFLLRFKNLRATSGNLTIRINAMSLAPGGNARTIKMISQPLRELAHVGGEVEVALQAKRNMIYAVLGLTYGPTDAAADGFEIVLDRPADGSSYEDDLAEAKHTVFGRSTFKDVPRLINLDRATLADPVSQMCTSGQMDEPAYDGWLEALKVAKHYHRKQWEFVYVAQALDRCDMLQPGSRGIGFGVGGESLPAMFASLGCSILATDLPASDARAMDWNATGQHLAEREALRRPSICPDNVFDERVSFRPVDMNSIPSDLVDFDFCWSACALEHLGSIRKGLEFVTASLECLKVGGVAVHTTELNLSSNDETWDNAGTVLFRRRDLERLALELVSHGHEVAQFKYDQGDRPMDRHVDVPPYTGDKHLKLALGQFVSTSFGIIVRKGLPLD